LAEGSIWEAFQYGAWSGLDNLTAIVDVNRLRQTRETMLGWDVDGYAARARAFGWHPIGVDGHDVDAIDAALAEATVTTGCPTVLFARTLKGRGVKAVEDQPGKHGKPLDDAEAAISELGGERHLTVQVAVPKSSGAPHRFPTTGAEPPTWALGEQVATRQAYGQALAALGGRRGDVVALDGEVSNSTATELFLPRL
jgi:transketolase